MTSVRLSIVVVLLVAATATSAFEILPNMQPSQFNFLKQQPPPPPQPRPLYSNPLTAQQDPFAALANELLLKCSLSGKTPETCDMCALCQNGAICQQRPKDPLSSAARAPVLSPSGGAHNALAFLKSQINLICYCVPGYSGTYCQRDINECLSNPCSNNATCIDRINAYECRCPPGFRGDLCEININECESTPCAHGGTCVDLIDGFYCHCPAGFTGPTCSIDIDDCAGNPCKNNVTCIDRVNRFECNCTGTGFEGALCEHNIDDCLNVQCQHNATCVDGINSFKCQCYPGYEGRFCEVDIDECASSPCDSEGGICWQNSDEKGFLRRIQLLSQTTTPASVTTAPLPLETTSTTNVNDWDSGQLVQNATEAPPSSHAAVTSFDLSFAYRFNYSKAEGYWCECRPGFTGADCRVNINECESSPCGFNGKCMDLVNGYKCLCYPGYTGANCQENIDECALYAPCAQQTKCVDIRPDYRSLMQNVYGVAPGVEMDDESMMTLDGYYCDCSDLNEQLFKASGNRDVIYAGQNCTLKVNACETLKHLCQHNSTCQSILTQSGASSSGSGSGGAQQDIMCQCRPGYTGKYCQFITTLGFDGTYSIEHQTPAVLGSSGDNSSGSSMAKPPVQASFARPAAPVNVYHLKFDFRVEFFHEKQRRVPLVYIEAVEGAARRQLVLDVTLHRQFIHVRNKRFQLDEKLPFFYDASEPDYFKLWHSLEIVFTLLDDDDKASSERGDTGSGGQFSQIQLTYSVKDMHLAETRLVDFSSKGRPARELFRLRPNYFKVGKFYASTSDYYLSGACLRDVTLNGDCLFKSDAENLSAAAATAPNETKIRYGCVMANNPCTANQETPVDYGGPETTTPALGQQVCKHNSTCVYKWFDYQCTNCQRPYYGKNCELESSKIVFLNDWSRNPMPFVTLRRDSSRRPATRSRPAEFQMSFTLKRFVAANLGSDDLADEFSFLKLTEKPRQGGSGEPNTTSYYYTVGVNEHGFLSLRRVKRELVKEASRHADLFSGLSASASLLRYNESLVWTLVNDKINLNNLSATAVGDEAAVKISVRISDPYVKLSVNDTFMAGYELVSSQPRRPALGEIDELKFGYSSVGIGASGHKHGFYRQPRPQSFIVSDLSINSFYYDLANNDQQQQPIYDMGAIPSLSSDDYFALNVLNKQSGHLLIRNEKQVDENEVFNLLNVNSVDLFKESLSDQEIVAELGQNFYNANCSFEPGSGAGVNATGILGLPTTTPRCLVSVLSRLRELDPKANSRLESDNNTMSSVVFRPLSERIHVPTSTNLTCQRGGSPGRPNKITRDPACDRFATVKRRLFNTKKSYLENEESFLNYYFDFDNSSSSSSSASEDASGSNGSGEASYSISSDLDQIISTSSERFDRRRIHLLKEVEFYSISFELNLNQNRHLRRLLGERAGNPLLDDAFEMRTNLFTLNTFDHYTSNSIFLFGLNMFAKKNMNLTSASTSIEQIQYEFEIFTSKHNVRSQPINLITNPLGINVTFTFNSIELRLNNNDDYLVQLTDRYFNLFFSSLLKAFGAFQLNLTSPLQLAYNYERGELGAQTSLVSTPGQNTSFLIAACFSNFNLVTRKRIVSSTAAGVEPLNYNLSSSYTYENFRLIDQTKSVSYSQAFVEHLAGYEDKNDYGQQCEADLAADATQSRARMMNEEATKPAASTAKKQPQRREEKCFLITKINSTTSQKINEYYDCKCNATSETDSQACRSYYFWANLGVGSGGEMDEDDQLNEEDVSASVAAKNNCKNAGDYACFNNGTCIDDPEANDYKCLCKSFYTGQRCETFDPCLNNPCSPDSVCLPIVINNDQMSYECKCNKGFLGRNCTIKFDETCLASPCLNGGTCINVTSIDEPQKLTYECMCLAGFEGKNCEKQIDYCQLYEPCSNGGLCSNTRYNNSKVLYRCSCAKGWRGVNCTQDVDECAQMRNKFITPCSGNGQCLNTRGSYKCQCNEYHYGSNCEHTHICQQQDAFDQRPCQNGAICLIAGQQISDNNYECKCTYGYTGVNCTQVTCDLQPCKHESTCIMTSATTYECNCTGTGYIGTNCETLINEAECRSNACYGNRTCDPSRCECETINCEDTISKHMRVKPKEFIYHFILWPLLGLMLALLIILFSIFLMKVKKSRATRGTYSPSRHEQQASRIEFNMDIKKPPEERLI